MTKSSSTISLSIAAITAVASQPAIAADCEALEAIFSAQASKFESLKGDVKQTGVMSYVYFPKAAPGVSWFKLEDCGIRTYSSTVEYRCEIGFPDLETMQVAFDAAQREIRQCLIVKSSSKTSVSQQETGFVPANGAKNNLTLGTKRGRGDTLVVYLSTYALRK